MLYPLVGQTASGESDIGFILNIIYIGSFIVFMFYGQKIQTFMMLREIGGAIDRLVFLKNEARRIAVKAIKETRKGETEDPGPRVDHLMEYFTIIPNNLDPNGIVPKIDHLLDVRDRRFKEEVKMLAPDADEAQSYNLDGVIGVSLDLNEIYKIVRHFYLLGKKTMSLYVIMQVQMQLPLIMQIAEANFSALKAFAEGQPIGDGTGPIVAGKMMVGLESKEVVKDTMAAETTIDGRRIVLVKAKGPGSNVGKPGDAIRKIVEDNGGKISLIIMIDAAGKLEGEETGTTAEGSGSIIGGLGNEQFKIEEVATKYKIPIDAVAVKQSLQEAISPMVEEIYDGTEIALARVKRMLRERTKEGDTIIVAGIGNSIGVGQ